MIGLVAGCGGLLFGYDIGVSGGVISMPHFQEKFFPSVYEKAQAAEAGDTDPCEPTGLGGLHGSQPCPTLPNAHAAAQLCCPVLARRIPP